MNSLFVILLAAGTLSWGTDSLDYTRIYRGIENPDNLCMVGVQHRHLKELGNRLKFYNIDTGEITDVLVTDVQAAQYVGTEEEMEHVGLLADVSCKEMVYSHGFLFKISSEKNAHPTSLAFDLGGDVVSRITGRLRSPHSVCSGDPRDVCVRQIEEWIDGKR